MHNLFNVVVKFGVSLSSVTLNLLQLEAETAGSFMPYYKFS